MKAEPTDRELLKALFDLLNKQEFVIMGDKPSVRDMVMRYKNPPITLYRPAAINFPVSDFHRLRDLLKETRDHLYPKEQHEPLGIDAAGNPGDLSDHVSAQ